MYGAAVLLEAAAAPAHAAAVAAAVSQQHGACSSAAHDRASAVKRRLLGCLLLTLDATARLWLLLYGGLADVSARVWNFIAALPAVHARNGWRAVDNQSFVTVNAASRIPLLYKDQAAGDTAIPPYVHTALAPRPSPTRQTNAFELPFEAVRTCTAAYHAHSPAVNDWRGLLARLCWISRSL